MDSLKIYDVLKDIPEAPRPEVSPIITINTGSGSTMIREYEILDLLPENDKILRTPAEPFDFKGFNRDQSFNSLLNPVYLGNSLFETMFLNKGLGLAAPQCGIPYAVFVMGADPKNKQIMFNPVILQESAEKDSSIEGCLSYRNLFVKIPRAKAITVLWWTADGKEHTGQFEGLTARVIQHEIDHLRGRVFWEGAGDTSLKMAQIKRTKLIKKRRRP